MRDTKQPWFACLQSIIFASLASMLVFILFAWVIGAAFNEIENQTLREIILHIVMMVLYAVFFYRFRIYKRLVTYAEHTGRFEPKKELLAYFCAEGKGMIILYGVAAVAAEASCWMIPEGERNPVVAASHFFMGPWMAMDVPGARALLAFAYSSALVCLLAIMRSRKIYTEKLWLKQEKADRRE